MYIFNAMLSLVQITISYLVRNKIELPRIILEDVITFLINNLDAILISNERYVPIGVTEYEKYWIVEYKPEDYKTQFIKFNIPFHYSFKNIYTNKTIQNTQQKVENQILEINSDQQTIFIEFYGGNYLEIQPFNQYGNMFIKKIIQIFWKHALDRYFEYKIVPDVNYISHATYLKHLDKNMNSGCEYARPEIPMMIKKLYFTTEYSDELHNNKSKYLRFINQNLKDISNTQRNAITIGLESYFDSYRVHHIEFSTWYNKLPAEDQESIILYYHYKFVH